MLQSTKLCPTLDGCAVCRLVKQAAATLYPQSSTAMIMSSAPAAQTALSFHSTRVLRSKAASERLDSRYCCVQADIPCSYAFLSGISYTMREVSKVMLGAAAVLSNGTVLGRVGSAAVAMCAAASSKVRPGLSLQALRCLRVLL
jgi:translation initiation factor eIF-2B subunit delta